MNGSNNVRYPWHLIPLSLVFVITMVLFWVFEERETDALAGQDDVPTGVVTGNYADVKSVAEAGFMQIVTIPWFDSFDYINELGLVELEDTPSKDVLAGHPTMWTLAISQLTYDDRIGRDVYICWLHDYDHNSPTYNQPFLMWEDDLRYIFEQRYGAYALQYSGY